MRLLYGAFFIGVGPAYSARSGAQRRAPSRASVAASCARWSRSCVTQAASRSSPDSVPSRACVTAWRRRSGATPSRNARLAARRSASIASAARGSASRYARSSTQRSGSMAAKRVPPSTTTRSRAPKSSASSSRRWQTISSSDHSAGAGRSRHATASRSPSSASRMRGSRARSARTLVTMPVRSRIAGYCRLGATRGGAMGFDYGKYFGEIKLTHDLTTRADERTWRLAAPEATPARKPIVLYLGCNVLRTSHMIRTVTAVPGLRLVPLASEPRFGRSCAPAIPIALGQEIWDGLVRDEIERARAAGADTLACVYHGCQRMTCGFEAEGRITIEHYLSVFARALGIEFEDQFKKYRLWGDPDRVLEDATPCMQANGVDPDKARALVMATFARRPGPGGAATPS